ncbi:MAG: hypothetical protein AAFZ11_00785 [Pseudomonadota bacterium]
MDQQNTIRDIEWRARRAYSSISAVCSRAGIPTSTFYRWKKSEKNPHPTSPTMSTLQKVLSALEAIEADAKADAAAIRSGVAA